MAAVTAVNYEFKKIKYVTASSFPLFICHEVVRLDAMILVFKKNFLWLNKKTLYMNF